MCQHEIWKQNKALIQITAFWKAGVSMLTADEKKGVSVFSDFTAQIVLLS